MKRLGIFKDLSPQTPDTLTRPDRWRDSAACRDKDPEAFFAVGDSPAAQQQTADAKALCHRCPVMDTCLNWALDTRQDAGVWGGLDEKERHNLRRRRARHLPDPEPALPRTHRSVYGQYIRSVEDGHAKPTQRTAAVSINGQRWTLAQLSFFLTRGRMPVGKVSQYCGEHGCLAGSHLGDSVIRDERDAAAKQTTPGTHAWNSGGGRLPAEYQPRKVDPAQVDEIRAQSLDGESLQDLALKYGVTTATIRNYAVKATPERSVA